MTIDDDLLEPESITEGDRALELFTDRYEFTRLFVERLNDDPAPKNILFLYGEGGNGKSLLLEYLRKKACKRLIAKGDWAFIKAKPDAALADNVVRLKPQVCYAVPTAFLDFGSKPLGDAQPQSRFFGLLTLRKDLAESAIGNYSLLFRRFDFACVWYLYKKGKSPDEIKAFFPLDQAGNLASVLVDVLTKNPFGTVGKAVLDVFNPDWSQQLMVRMARFGLAKTDIETIFRLDVDAELIEALPGYFAADLNDAMAKDNAPPRVVLFFDTHEAFWGENRTEARDNYFFRDEWLRLLLRKLNYQAGIVAVVAGREPPRWAEAGTIKANTNILAQHVDLHRVGNLSAVDALAYLQKPTVGIADMALCQSLIAYASVEPGEVHPLHLGLCADVVLQAQNKGTPLTAEAFDTVPDFADKSKRLVERLLRYVNEGVRDAVYALSACRAFDFALYNQLGETLKFAANRADYNLITQFSFVKQLPAPRQDWHRLHGLLRRLNAEDGNERVIEAHHFLEQHYRELGQQAEAIYHANQLDPRQGAQEWISTFNEAMELSRYQDCETLLEVRRALRLVSYFQLGLMSQSEGDHYQNLARHAEAEQEYLEAIWAQQQSLKTESDDVETQNNLGNSYVRLGDLQLRLSSYQAALSSYQQAIAAFDEALRRAPDFIHPLNNKGNALQSLGDLQAGLSQHTDALARYQQAIAAYDEALRRAPDYINALNNKGNALQGFGDLQAGLSQHTDALASYQQAIATYDEALRHAPDFINALNNKGSALQSFGALQAGLSQHTDALACYQQAIATYDEALRHAPDFINALNNKGSALQSLGNLQAGLSHHTDALASYQQAIAAYDEALRRAPDDINALNNKGSALKSLGNLQAGLSQHTDALARYQQAIATFDEALRRAPDFINALNNKGNALQSLGNLQAGLSQHTDALARYQQAIATFDEALRRAPNFINALNNKGLALQSLGDLQAGLSQHTDALARYQQAIAAYDEALRYAPDYIQILNNKGLVLKRLGDLQAGLSQHTDALASYQQAIAAYDEALRRAPDDINALNNKGSALERIGNLQAALSQHTDALTRYQQAIATFDKALRRAPDDIYTLNNKGNALQSLGDLQAGLSQHTDALARYQQAIAAYDEALRCAPDYIYALNNKGLVLMSLAQLQSSLEQKAEARQNLELALVYLSRSLALAPNNAFIRNLYDQIQTFFAGSDGS